MCVALNKMRYFVNLLITLSFDGSSQMSNMQLIFRLQILGR